jgi:pimeloyl-ACP methyl ester carboxylesterase
MCLSTIPISRPATLPSRFSDFLLPSSLFSDQFWYVTGPVLTLRCTSDSSQINFGGPGGTAAENLPAPLIAEQVVRSIGEQWNIVSWDPRGTGYTIPFDCPVEQLTGSLTPPTKRDIGKRDLGPLVSTNVTDTFVNGAWNASEQVADFCAQQVGEQGTLIGTAFTARDMIQIVDALGEDGLLRYYGWSYGTALGSYGK